ncbi:MAG: hypothetical protein M1825_006245 [Sarcosagium campestre]|nr:MAG: hypothetical protein M1825_006245 [Sarcosagium campestre]
MAKKRIIAPMNDWLYDLILWVLSVLVDLFFREVHPRGSWKIPRRGPVIFVAAPHANQFVDPLILMRTVRREAHRRISILTAEKSMRRKFIGAVARASGAVPVSRALDFMKPGAGKIYLPDPVDNPSLVRGIDTRFDTEAQVGGLIILPSVNGSAANAEILEILGSDEIVIKKDFKGSTALTQLTGREDINEDGEFIDGDGPVKLGVAEGFKGTTYKLAPKVDQTKVYDAVFERLNDGGCVGIFPEGGSHDRTELLPLKAGVAIMALGALAANPGSGLKIVPCGMNYFHAHKFRSRAVIEFGTPVEIPSEWVELYRKGERREAVKNVLETVYQSLVAVTVTSPDYDTLMVRRLRSPEDEVSLHLQVIQAARRLYRPSGKKLPLPMVVELNRRLVKGYTVYKDDPQIVQLKDSVVDYNKQLRLLGLRDHQVEYARFSVPMVIFTLLYRLGKIIVLSVGTLPGLVLFAPVFIATKIISVKKAKEALAASTVKIQARDVMATWKLLVALALAPSLYTFYGVLFAYLTYSNRVWGYVPSWVPLWSVIILEIILFPSVTFAALRFGEIGMDILKSLRPLVLSLNPTSANTIYRLRQKRAALSNEVTELINARGPELYDDFDSTRIIADPFRASPRPEAHTSSSSTTTATTNTANANANTGGDAQETAETASPDVHLPRNESFGNLASIGLFATRPPSRSRSRSSSHSGHGPFQGFSALSSNGGFEEVSAKIRGAMRERGVERTRKRSEDLRLGSETTSGVATPLSTDDGTSKKLA